jgi:hypothetical protein
MVNECMSPPGFLLQGQIIRLNAKKSYILSLVKIYLSEKVKEEAARYNP